MMADTTTSDETGDGDGDGIELGARTAFGARSDEPIDVPVEVGSTERRGSASTVLESRDLDVFYGEERSVVRVAECGGNVAEIALQDQLRS